MSRTGRRLAAALAAAKTAAVTGLIGLAAVSVLSAFGSLESPGQETIIDLSSVESAPEYRTDPPAGSGFLGSEADALDRSLPRINKALGTSLRPDGRLAVLARWIHRRLGPNNAMPPEIAFDVLTHRLGLAEPVPLLLVAQAANAAQLAGVVSTRLAEISDLSDYTHIGGVAERDAGGVDVVIVISRRPFRMEPLPRSLPGPGQIKLDGRLVKSYERPELAHTLPTGETRIEPLGPGPGFSMTVDLEEIGRHRLEITAQGPKGPDVLANFPVFVGVPVDKSVETTRPPLRAENPDYVRQRLFALINAERVKAGLNALAFDPRLAEVAMKHSEDMRDGGFVSHVSPTTGTTEDRLLRAGIVTNLAAENVGKGYSSDEIHQGFMDSPAHRAAILLPGVTHIGIGVAPKAEYDRTTYLITELFIRRIPALGPDARAVLLRELNDLRRSGGSTALEEDPTLTGIADQTAREFLEDETLSQDDAMGRLRQRLGRADLKARSALTVLSIGGSLEEGAHQVGADPRAVEARRVGIGIAQGNRKGLAPNSIILVLVFVE